jgi:hypothetical protein
MSYKVNEDYFKTWTHNMAYVFGFWYADGHIFAKGDHYSFSLAIKEADRYLLEMIKKDMGSEHPVLESHSKSPHSDYISTVCKLTIGSKTIVEDIISLGGQFKKSLVAKLPEIPIEFSPDFIRGLFDGDGTIVRDVSSKTWVAGIYSATQSFVVELQDYLIKQIPDLSCPIGASRENTLFRLSFSANNARRLAKFMYNTPSLLFLYRKHNKFLEMGNKINLRSAGAFNNPIINSMQKEDIEKGLLESGNIGNLSKHLGVHRSTLTRFMKSIGVDWKDILKDRKIKKTTKSGMEEKLTNLTPDVLVTRLSDGESLLSIADDFGVPRRTISKRCDNYGIDWKSLGKDKKEEFRQSRIKTSRYSNGALDVP